MRRLFTWFSPGKSAQVDDATTSPEVVEDLRKRIKRLEIQFLELQDDFAALMAQHAKLRGRLTGGLRSPQGGDPADIDSIPQGDKRALREFARQRGLFRKQE